jgi:hypothetical protein
LDVTTSGDGDPYGRVVRRALDQLCNLHSAHPSAALRRAAKVLERAETPEPSEEALERATAASMPFPEETGHTALGDDLIALLQYWDREAKLPALMQQASSALAEDGYDVTDDTLASLSQMLEGRSKQIVRSQEKANAADSASQQKANAAIPPSQQEWEGLMARKSKWKGPL